MEFKKDGNRLLMRLQRGEELIQTVQRFAEEQKIPNATVIGIGAVDKLDLGYWNLEREEYTRRQFPGPHELLNLSGNLSWKDGASFLHVHAIVANPEFTLVGGHLFAATVTATAELSIWPGEYELHRAHDASIGMKLWNLGA